MKENERRKAQRFVDILTEAGVENISIAECTDGKGSVGIKCPESVREVVHSLLLATAVLSPEEFKAAVTGAMAEASKGTR